MIGEFHYEIEWRTGRYRPGHHRSKHPGSGFEFANHASLFASPDPRRLDLHATLRNPFGEPIVRVYRQRSAIRVYVLADVSASLGFIGIASKRDVLTNFTISAAYSAARGGDAFGFYAANQSIVQELSLPATHARGVDQLLAERLQGFQPTGDSAAGLEDAAALLGRERALVFLVSDFHFPITQLESLLRLLGTHHVVPVLIWDRAEFSVPKRWGLSNIVDIESGKQRTILISPSSKQRLLKAFQHRRGTLREIFLRHGLRPLELLDGFEAERVSQYFLDPHAAAENT